MITDDDVNETTKAVYKPTVYEPKVRRTRQQQNIILALKFLLLLVIFFLGFIIGWFAMKSNMDDSNGKAGTSNLWRDKTKYREDLVESMSAKSIETFLKFFTKHPHIGGSEQNRLLGEYMRDMWKGYGFDKVEMPRYDVLLSMPPKNKPNAVKIINTATNKTIVNVEGPEKTAVPSEKDPLVVSPFLAYSPPGDVTGDLIYVNYGTTDDFKKLGQTCTGKIAIMRYGKIFRGNKINNAYTCGAVGAILYSDPADFAPMGINDTFPNSWWMPGTGAQRGSVLNMRYYGDPVTPILPSTEGIYRIPADSTDTIPKIPAQTMTYNDALEFLKRMKGADVPPAWKGGLPIIYKLGPGFTDSDLKVRLVVNNELVTRPGYNVIGTIIGREEPDRIVLIGNHRDAWVFGAVDPSSGTAIMMEVARAMGKLLKETNWRPRRTIMFCSWAVEEYALIGSAEWVTENEKMLSDRAAMYINIDSGVAGNYSFRADGSPQLMDLVYSETSKTKDHNEKDMTVYDKWTKKYPGADDKTKPSFPPLGSGSDYTSFVQTVGVACVDMGYEFFDKRAWPYPVYHSVHDNFYWMKTFTDPNFKSHLTMAQVSGRLLITAADSPLLPLATKPYKEALIKGYGKLKTTYQAKLAVQNITLDYIGKEITKFAKAADAFETAKEKAKGSADFITLRMLNDQMMKLERSFIWPYGLPGRIDTRHVVFAPQVHNLYGKAVFPGINDAMYDVTKTGDWRTVKQQISIVTQSLRAAVGLLQPITSD